MTYVLGSAYLIIVHVHNVKIINLVHGLHCRSVNKGNVGRIDEWVFSTLIVVCPLGSQFVKIKKQMKKGSIHLSHNHHFNV